MKRGKLIGILISCVGVLLIAVLMFVFVLRNVNTESTNVDTTVYSSTYEYEYGERTVNTSGWDLTKVNIVYDTNNVPVPVPIGYVASGATGEHTVDTGFVIYEGEGEVTDENAWSESCSRNNWVWVPVYDTSRIYTESSGRKTGKLYDFSSTGRSLTTSHREPAICYDTESDFAQYYNPTTTRESFLEDMQECFDSTMKSIEKYGGFYIGRYETGNLSSDKPVVQRMNTDISNKTWYEMYGKMKYLGANKNVRASMIWGSLWDETLQWFIDSEATITTPTADEDGNLDYVINYTRIGSDSTEWGNYYNATFTYTNASGGTSTKSKNSGIKIPSGSTEYTRVNNIYDMAGNVYDWTLERNSINFRSVRGNCYYNYDYQCTASYRYSNNYLHSSSSINSSDSYILSRFSSVLLYSVALNLASDALDNVDFFLLRFSV